MLTILGHALYYLAAGIAVLAVAGMASEAARNNHPGKPLMRGCHGTLVCAPWSTVARPGDTFLCLDRRGVLTKVGE